MYRILLMLSIISGGYVAFLYFNSRKSQGISWKNLFSLPHAIQRWGQFTLIHRPALKDHATYNGILGGSALISIISFLLLAITGFLPVLITGKHVSGLLLIIHVTIAPVLVISVTILVLLIVKCLQLHYEDFKVLLEWKKSANLKQVITKIEFWCAYVLLIIAIVSIILMLYPFFGTEGQEILLNIHRYSTLILFLLFQHQVFMLAKKNSIKV